jgi:hypothetical protein
MRMRSKLFAGAVLVGIVSVPAMAQTMVIAPLPPERPRDLALQAAPVAAVVDPGAALHQSVAIRSGVERRQQAQIMPSRLEQDIPMPRGVPSIMAPSRP